ncbi:MAG: hypothetical protein GEU95_09325 [Rhizobiales bacterium]|nr:hypothetical protein [Hyphomicrobiales bacterium]
MVQTAKFWRSIAPYADLRAPCVLALTVACLAVPAQAQPDDDAARAGVTVESDVTPGTGIAQEKNAEFDQPIDFSAPLPTPSGSSIDSSRFTHGLPAAAWTGKAGVDSRDITPYADMPWLGAMPAQSVGVAWATVTAPGLMAWDKTAIETRVDPYEQTRFGVTLSRSVPFGSDVAMTLQNAFAWTQPLLEGAPIVAHGSHVVEGNHAVRFTFLPANTTLSIGASTSTAESGWRPSLSAEQRLFGGPLSITGAVSETATGELDRSLKAGFKRRW